jgi:uncharacterized protein with beta-barrel porin domain
MVHTDECGAPARRWRAWLAGAWLWLGLAGAAWAQSSLALAGGTLPEGVVGDFYTYTVSASGGLAPYTYTLVGSLPPGLSLDQASGEISGTPSSDGSYSFSITASDSATAFVTAAYDMDVVLPPSIAPPTLPDGRVGETYTQYMSVANGGTDPYHFTVVSGSLPPGLTLDLGGTLTGTPTAAGYYGFKIHAESALPPPHFGPSPTATFPVGGITQDYMIDIDPAPVSVSPSSLPQGRVGEAYSATVTASGGTAPYTYAVTSGALPGGLSLDAATGAITGTPDDDATFGFRITATDADEAAGSRVYSVDILPPVLSLSPATLPDGTVGAAYSATVTVLGAGSPPYTFDIVSGVLPPGVSLVQSAPDAVAISGTPSAAGSYAFKLQATDSDGHVASFGYTIAVDTPVIVIAPAALPDGQVGVAYAQALTASGGTAPYTFAVTGGALPPGMSLDSGGALSGTPATAGNYAFVVTTTDADGNDGAHSYGLAIAAAPSPTVATLHATTPMNTPVQVGLTEGAGGGPFTGADVVSISPANAGTTAVAQAGDDYVLTFSPAQGFFGTATVHYTISNAAGPSAPGVVTIDVTPLADPLVDAEVAGLAQSQATIAQVFAQTQVTNIVDRLERLQEPRTQAWGFWVAGAFRRGDLDANGNAEGLTFETSGVTTGADRQFGDRFSFGVAGGLAQDRTLVGGHGSRSDSNAHAAVGYGSFHPPESPFFVNALHGHQRLSFQLRRFVPGAGAGAGASAAGSSLQALAASIRPLAGGSADLLDSERTGGQDFSSLGGGYRYKGKAWTFTSYGRQDDISTQLDAYTEPGGSQDALHYDAQSMRTRTSIVGFRADGKREIRWGTLLPKLKIELQRDNDDPGVVAVRYASQPDGPVFRAEPRALDNSRVALELGATLVTRRFLTLRLEYHAVVGGLYSNDNAIVFSFEKEH